MIDYRKYLDSGYKTHQVLSRAITYISIHMITHTTYWQHLLNSGSLKACIGNDIGTSTNSNL